MCDVDTDESGGLLGEPAESVAGELVVDPTELGVHLESDVGQILVLLAFRVRRAFFRGAGTASVCRISLCTAA
jgi:hypothetical protein